MITIKYIKELVEVNSGVKNLHLNSRTEDLIEARQIAYKLCKDFIHGKEGAYRKIAIEFGLISHATVLHHVREFNSLFDTPQFRKSKELYLSIRNMLLIKQCLQTIKEVNSTSNYNLELSGLDGVLIEPEFIDKAEIKDNTLKLEIVDLKSKLKRYTDSTSLRKLTNVGYDDFVEADKRIGMFIKSIEWKNKLKVNNLEVISEEVN